MDENTKELFFTLQFIRGYPSGNKKFAIEKLLLMGCSTNAKDFEGQSPLFLACRRGPGWVDIARLLIEYGAEVNTTNLIGKTPLWKACSVCNVEIAALLIDHGANVNPDSYYSPMHYAATSRRVAGDDIRILNILIQAGANLEKYARLGTPLHAATEAQNVECMRTLLKAGSNVNACFNARLMTPLHRAVMKDNFEAAKILLEFGANVYARYGFVSTPRCLIQNADSPLEDLLLSYESNPAQLKDLCRRKIRGVLVKRKRLRDDLSELKLPDPLTKYMKHEN